MEATCCCCHQSCGLGAKMFAPGACLLNLAKYLLRDHKVGASFCTPCHIPQVRMLVRTMQTFLSIAFALILVFLSRPYRTPPTLAPPPCRLTYQPHPLCSKPHLPTRTSDLEAARSAAFCGFAQEGPSGVPHPEAPRSHPNHVHELFSHANVTRVAMRNHLRAAGTGPRLMVLCRAPRCTACRSSCDCCFC